MTYVTSLFEENLIDTEEYQAIKAEIQEEWDEYEE